MIIEKYVTMGERGQIVIPKEIRDRERLVGGDLLKVLDLNGEMFIRAKKGKTTPEHRILEILRKAKFTQKDWEQIRRERNIE